MLIEALKRVFRKGTYSLLAVVIGVVVFVLTLWLPNINLLLQIGGDPGISLTEKISLYLSLLGAIGTNFTLLSAFYTVTIAALLGARNGCRNFCTT